VNGIVRAAMKGAVRCMPADWKRGVKRSLLHVTDTEGALAEMARRGFDPKVVIDVGAYIGEWTRTCRRVFPHATVLMVEPQSKCMTHLCRTASELPRTEFACVLLGASQRSGIPFHVLETASSVLKDTGASKAETVSIPMTTLDVVTEGTHFANPDLIKLDVQGYELEVLKGGERALKSAEAILMEVNLLPIFSGAPLFHEATEFMAQRGFYVYEFGNLYRRPYDDALWQVDVFFVRSTSRLLACQTWS
jgi:FkbM family methyltransferase